MHPRQELRQVAIALIRDDHGAARLGDKEVRARDADIGGEKLLPQNGARFVDEVRNLGKIALRRQAFMERAKVFLDLVAVQMDGGRDDVAWRFVANLNDIFAKIGLDRLDACGLQRCVKPISSETMDLPLVTDLRACIAAKPKMISRASAASRAQCTWPPDAITLRSYSSR